MLKYWESLEVFRGGHCSLMVGQTHSGNQHRMRTGYLNSILTLGMYHKTLFPPDTLAIVLNANNKLVKECILITKKVLLHIAMAF